MCYHNDASTIVQATVHHTEMYIQSALWSNMLNCMKCTGLLDKHKIAGLHLRYHHWSWKQASVWAESRDLYVATLSPGWEPGLIEYITRLYLTKCPSQIRSIFHVTAIPGRPREKEREEKMAVWKGWFEIGLVSIKVWSMVHIFIIHTKVRVS